MCIGIMGGAPGLKIAPDHTPDGLVEWGKELEADGFHTLWLAHTAELDAITALSWVGRETGRIELGTAVVPTYSRHPIAMAQQALTASAACGGRFPEGEVTYVVVSGFDHVVCFALEPPAEGGEKAPGKRAGGG